MGGYVGANSQGIIASIDGGTISNATLGSSNKIESLVGMIASFAMPSAPTGWLVCDGSAVSRTTYADLFTAIGTTWGAGDGSSTFALPDLEGAFLRGTGSHGTSTMANGSAFSGPSVGSFEDDQMQGHIFGAASSGLSTISNGAVGTSSGFVYTGSPPTATGSVVIQPDGINGTPRTGDETRSFNAGVKYCIKY